MLILHVSAPTGHLQGGNLHRNICITNTVQDVLMLCYNTLLLINTLLKMCRPTAWIWINIRYNGFTRNYISEKRHVYEVFRKFLHVSLSAPEILINNKTLANKPLHELLYDTPLQKACVQTRVSTPPLNSMVAVRSGLLEYESQQTARIVCVCVCVCVCVWCVHLYVPFGYRSSTVCPFVRTVWISQFNCVSICMYRSDIAVQRCVHLYVPFGHRSSTVCPFVRTVRISQFNGRVQRNAIAFLNWQFLG
jgi:hypothetical protein